MKPRLQTIKDQIVIILRHPEAEDGLYFRNFFLLHEEDERPILAAQQADALAALSELVGEGKVRLTEVDGEIVFMLGQPNRTAAPRAAAP